MRAFPDCDYCTVIIQILMIKEKKTKNMAYTAGGFKNIFVFCSLVFERHTEQKTEKYLWQRQYLIKCMI